jgi:hypothetical protein
MTIPLEAMIRRVSREAVKLFDERGSVPMLWLVETATGEQAHLITSVEESTPEYKRAFAEEMRELFQEKQVARYARAMECWTAADEGSNKWLLEHGTLADYPQPRSETVLLDADDGRRYLNASREIIRPAGGRPYLGKLSEIAPGILAGRFSDLLNRVRPTSELADDEGTVFITDLPHAPFQVLGRRGPTGELFVGSVYSVKQGHKPVSRESLARAPVSVEVVTGPEADRLIAGVLRRLGDPFNKH